MYLEPGLLMGKQQGQLLRSEAQNTHLFIDIKFTCQRWHQTNIETVHDHCTNRLNLLFAKKSSTYIVIAEPDPFRSASEDWAIHGQLTTCTQSQCQFESGQMMMSAPTSRPLSSSFWSFSCEFWWTTRQSGHCARLPLLAILFSSFCAFQVWTSLKILLSWGYLPAIAFVCYVFSYLLFPQSPIQLCGFVLYRPKHWIPPTSLLTSFPLLWSWRLCQSPSQCAFLCQVQRSSQASWQHFPN